MRFYFALTVIIISTSNDNNNTRVEGRQGQEEDYCLCKIRRFPLSVEFGFLNTYVLLVFLSISKTNKENKEIELLPKVDGV